MMKKKDEIRKTELFTNFGHHQQIKMDFIYADEFVFVRISRFFLILKDRTLNEEYMDSTANKTMKKFGYHMVSQIKKPLNVPKDKTKEPLSCYFF